MTNQTAAQAAIAAASRENQENRMHRLHMRFRRLYAPAGGVERDAFEADLVMLMREVAIDALKPFQDAAAVQLASRPMPPVILNKEAK